MPGLTLATGSALAELKIGLQEIIDLVAYGLSVESPSQRTSRTIIPDTPFQINPHPTWALEQEEAALRFRSWTIGNGFRELIDTATNFLEAIFVDCKALTFVKDHRSQDYKECEVQEFSAQLVAERSKFRKLPLIQKLSRLKKLS